MLRIEHTQSMCVFLLWYVNTYINKLIALTLYSPKIIPNIAQGNVMKSTGMIHKTIWAVYNAKAKNKAVSFKWSKASK